MARHNRTPRLILKRLLLAAALGACLTGGAGTRAQTPQATELYFSEYVEGTGNSKALEIYNGTGAEVDLAAGGYNVLMYFNGSPTIGRTINLAGTVAAGDVFVLASTLSDAAVLAQADQTSGSGWFNGDDAIVLRRGTAILDVIGKVGNDPGIEWGSGLASTADNTLRRKVAICSGDPDGTDDFTPSTEWDGFAADTYGGLGAHAAVCATADAAPTVAMTSPGDGDIDVPTDGTLMVTFSESVDVTGAWFALTCTDSGAHSASVAGGPVTFTLDPDVDFAAGESCTLAIGPGGVSDQDTADPPDTMAAAYELTFTTRADACAAPYTPIPLIQGAGPVAAITGAVTTQGVVVGDYEDPSPGLRGFFLQDIAGDGDATTSDGIFVFTGSGDVVAVGDVVRVTGTAGEFQGQTQIDNVTNIVPCGTAAVAPVDVTLPFPHADFAERYEGMLVRLSQTLHVTEHFQLGRFGQLVVSSGDRLYQPTHVVSPGAAAATLQAANDRNRLVIDDASNGQYPDPILFGRGGSVLSAANTLRAGDTASGLVGVMTYSSTGPAGSNLAWRVRPINALNGTAMFSAANPRPIGPPDVGGSLKVASLNLMNYFNTFGAGACRGGVGGPIVDCRGADSAPEFARQWPKTVTAIRKTGASVIGVVSIENDGYGAESALADLVSKLNAATAPGTYAYIDVDAMTGQANALGTDAIKVGFIYRPAFVSPIGQTAVLNTVAFVRAGDVQDRNRPALAQEFQTSAGGRFVAVVNHLKSRGSACDEPDAGDGQGECNLVRTRAASELAAWLAADPTGSGGAGLLIMGDLNAYAEEDPVAALESAGFTNAVADLGGSHAYSFAFDGQWGATDHALTSPDLGPSVTGAAHYHINADEPVVLDYNTDFKSAGQQVSLYAPDEYRSGDHDAVLVGLNLEPALAGHVTGAGWIDPPPLDFTQAQRGPGKMFFELSARYKGLARTPDGRVVISFPSTTFSFASRTLAWLAVSGSRASIEGEGAFNGQPGYGFRLTAIDGAAIGATDAVHVRIWVVSTGQVIYDSGGLRELGGGTLVIH